MVAEAILVMRELTHASVNRQIHAGIQIAVEVVADEILVVLDIRTDFNMEAVGRAFNRDGKLLKPVEEPRQLADLRLDVGAGLS